MKIFKSFFLTVIFPVIIVISICFAIYFSVASPMHSFLSGLTSQTEKRIEDIKEYDKGNYDVMLNEVKNEKIKFYIIMFGAFGILIIFGFHVIKIMLRTNTDALIFPEKYELIKVEEADAIKYIKDKLLEAQILRSDQLLTKDHVVKLLSNNTNFIEGPYE